MPFSHHPRLFRVVRISRLMRETRRLLAERSPDLVLVQNPPIHAVSAVAGYAHRHGMRFIIDAHTGAFVNPGLLAGYYRRLFSIAGHWALKTLIHNEDLVPYAEKLGLDYLVLEMAVPEPLTQESTELRHPAVVAACGWGRDEPLSVLLAAARLLPDVNFYLTGNRGTLPSFPPDAGRCPAATEGQTWEMGVASPISNVLTTGFLPELDYWRLLNGCDVVAVLTTREATILSGAYEALACRKPLVLSGTQTLARAFPKGAVLVENRAESLAGGISQALKHASDVSLKGIELAASKARDWERQFRALQEIISAA